MQLQAQAGVRAPDSSLTAPCVCLHMERSWLPTITLCMLPPAALHLPSPIHLRAISTQFKGFFWVGVARGLLATFPSHSECDCECAECFLDGLSSQWLVTPDLKHARRERMGFYRERVVLLAYVYPSEGPNMQSPAPCPKNPSLPSPRTGPTTRGAVPPVQLRTTSRSLGQEVNEGRESADASVCPAGREHGDGAGTDFTFIVGSSAEGTPASTPATGELSCISGSVCTHGCVDGVVLWLIQDAAL